MPEDRSPFLGPGTSSFKFTIFAGSIMAVFIADYLSIFLPYPVIMEFLSGWAEVGIFGFIILELIRIEGLVFSSIGIGLFGHIKGNSLFGTFL